MCLLMLIMYACLYHAKLGRNHSVQFEEIKAANNYESLQYNGWILYKDLISMISATGNATLTCTVACKISSMFVDTVRS